MKRRAPAGGYGRESHPEKTLYRNQVYNGFRQVLGDLRRKHVLLMPSAEGLEIDVALRKGCRQEYLHVVDMNPAIVAHLRRRYPKINTYGVTVSEACRRIAKSNARIDAANFDLTWCYGKNVVAEMQSVFESDCFASEAAVAITILRGRESAPIFGALRELSTMPSRASDARELGVITERGASAVDVERLRLSIGTPALSVGRSVVFVRAGIYWSPGAHQTMLWGVVVTRQIDEIMTRSAQRMGVSDLSKLLKDYSMLERDFMKSCREDHKFIKSRSEKYEP